MSKKTCPYLEGKYCTHKAMNIIKDGRRALCGHPNARKCPILQDSSTRLKDPLRFA